MTDKFTALSSELETCATSTKPNKCKILEEDLPLGLGIAAGGFIGFNLPNLAKKNMFRDGRLNGQELLQKIYGDGNTKVEAPTNINNVYQFPKKERSSPSAVDGSAKNNVVSLDEIRRRKAQIAEASSPVLPPSEKGLSIADKELDSVLKKFGIDSQGGTNIKDALQLHANELKKLDELETLEEEIKADLNRANQSKSVIARDQRAAPYRDQLEQVATAKRAALARVELARGAVNMTADITSISQAHKNQYRRVGGATIKAGLLGAAVEPLLIYGSDLRSYAAQKYCAEEKFSNKIDEESLKKYSTKGFDCKWNIAADRFWDIVMMPPAERKQLMGSSPALCKAFEDRFDSQLKEYSARMPTFDPKNIECSSDGKSISAFVEINKKIYRQEFQFADKKIAYKGSFLSGNNYKDIKGTSFTLPMNENGDFLLPNTENAIFYSQPSSSSLKTVNQIEEYALNPESNCSTLDNKDEANFSMARNPSSTSKLYCSVGEQMAAIKTSFKTLTAYCAKAKKGSSNRCKADDAEMKQGTK